MTRLAELFLFNKGQLLHLALEHVFLVLVSTGAATAIGIPVGILITRKQGLRKPVLAVANVLQTIPSLALFGFLIPILGNYGIGKLPAVIALFLYSLLPIIQNTFAGIDGIDPAVREAGRGMGMTDRQLLWQVEFPLSLGVILAGVRVAVVISVGTATIAAAIGAGGLGVLIFRGLRMNDNALVLAGAIPAAFMALSADFLLGFIQHFYSSGWNGKAGAPSYRKVLGVSAALILVVSFFFAGNFYSARGENEITIGSKDFTESVILGEMLAQAIETRAGLKVKRDFELGGDLAHRALLSGEIDGYAEYTGTAYTAILKHKPIPDEKKVYDAVKEEYAGRFHLVWFPPLGFNNTFAVLVREKTAKKYRLHVISDIFPYAAGWRVAFGQDFMSRKDGYPGFAKAYGLKFGTRPLEMDLALTYRALAEGQVDLIAGNSTDGLIEKLHLQQLQDDRHYFPPYQAAAVFRESILEKYPAVKEAVLSLSGKITEKEIRGMNYEVDGLHKSVKEVVKEFLSEISK